MGCFGSREIPYTEYNYASGTLVFFWKKLRKENFVKTMSLRLATMSNYTHIGVVVNLGDVFEPSTKRDYPSLFLLESDAEFTDGLTDYYTQTKVKSGVRLVPLFERIHTALESEHTVMVKSPIMNRMNVASSLEMFESIMEYREKPYEQNILEFITPVFSVVEGTDDGFFCSELCAHLYKKFEMYEGNPANMSPGSFVGNKFLLGPYTDNTVLGLSNVYIDQHHIFHHTTQHLSKIT